MASPQPVSAPITLEQFYEITGDRRAELVDGVISYDDAIVERASLRHGSVRARIANVLASWAYPRAAGELFGGATGFVLRRIPPIVRCPDIAFVAADRLAPDDFAEQIELAPDLAVEVVSPSNSAAQMDRKLDDYLDNGTRLVWLVDPDARRVVIHAADQPVRRLGESDSIDGGDVLPGFTTPIATFFAGLPK